MDGHSGLKDPGLDPDPQASGRIYEMREQGFCPRWFFGSVEARPSSLPDRAGQRKLRNSQNLAPDIGQGHIHLPGFIGKYPEFDGLPGQEMSILFGVPFLDPNQKAEPAAAPTHRLVPDLDPGLLHTLQDDFHHALSIRFCAVFFSILKIADRFLSSETRDPASCPIGKLVSPCSG
jgi:hypothetical protein